MNTREVNKQEPRRANDQHPAELASRIITDNRPQSPCPAEALTRHNTPMAGSRRIWALPVVRRRTGAYQPSPLDPPRRRSADHPSYQAATQVDDATASAIR